MKVYCLTSGSVARKSLAIDPAIRAVGLSYLDQDTGRLVSFTYESDVRTSGLSFPYLYVALVQHTRDLLKAILNALGDIDPEDIEVLVEYPYFHQNLPTGSLSIFNTLLMQAFWEDWKVCRLFMLPSIFQSYCPRKKNMPKPVKEDHVKLIQENVSILSDVGITHHEADAIMLQTVIYRDYFEANWGFKAKRLVPEYISLGEDDTSTEKANQTSQANQIGTQDSKEIPR